MFARLFLYPLFLFQHFYHTIIFASCLLCIAVMVDIAEYNITVIAVLARIPNRDALLSWLGIIRSNNRLQLP